jgi:hypothetical protein
MGVFGARRDGGGREEGGREREEGGRRREEGGRKRRMAEDEREGLELGKITPLRWVFGACRREGEGWRRGEEVEGRGEGEGGRGEPRRRRGGKGKRIKKIEDGREKEGRYRVEGGQLGEPSESVTPNI